MFVSAVILAGGSSSRMGRDKITAELCGVPVIAYSVECFSLAGADEIIIAAPESSAERIKSAVSFCKTPLKIVAGGKTRSESAANAVRAADSRCEIVSIHDGARPLVTSCICRRVFGAAERYGGAIAAVPAKDTVKVCLGDRITATPDRSALWLAQTPQAFLMADYLAALEEGRNFEDITDDAGLMERCGRDVRVVMGDYRNIKLTSPEDFLIAEAFLKSDSELGKGIAL